MVTIHAIPGRMLALGRGGENLARQIVFDISGWREAYGDGTVSLIAKRRGDTEPYPCNITVDGDTVTWPIMAADTEYAGDGICELCYTVGEVLVKSEMWRTFVADSLGTPSPTPPEPQKAWVDKVLAAGQAAVDASVNPPKIGENGNWFVWDFDAGKYVDTGVAASGGGGDAVSSVNGKSGAVELTAGDVNAVPSPDTASVGQIVRVKAVDDTGKPTEWEAADIEGGEKYSPTLPLIASITLTEEVSMIEISTDKDGNPLSLEEMDIWMNLYGGAGNTSRDSSIMYLNGLNTAVGRMKLGENIGATGLYLESSQYFVKREYGFRWIGQYGYAIYPGSSVVSINAFKYIDAPEKSHIRKQEKITQINLYPATDGYTFGVGTKIDIYGR